MQRDSFPAVLGPAVLPPLLPPLPRGARPRATGVEAVVIDAYSDDGEVAAGLLHLIDKFMCLVEGPRGSAVYLADIRLCFLHGSKLLF